jgi:protein PhnA
MSKDANGVELNDGDNVSAIKDLAVKGMKLKLKRGSVIKKIRLTNKDDEIECRIGKSTIVLKTQFFKKA